jgi:hypothetical protein
MVKRQDGIVTLTFIMLSAAAHEGLVSIITESPRSQESDGMDSARIPSPVKRPYRHVEILPASLSRHQTATSSGMDAVLR